MILTDILQEIFIPEKCVICGKFGYKICDRCVDLVKPLDFQECIFCNLLSINGNTHKLCSRHTSLESHISPFIYNSAVKKIIIKSKYGSNSFSLLNLLIKSKNTYSIIKETKQSFSPDLVIPIPATHHILQTRLINHSKFIAEKISDEFESTVSDIVSIIGSKKDQKTLSKQQRFNIKKHFYIQKKFHQYIHGSNVLIVDDVCTSGSTLMSLSSILRSLGANKIHAFTLCKQLLYN